MDSVDYRPLTAEELEILVWLLDHGPREAKNFLPQLDVLRARKYCKCGCPSIEFSVPVDAAYIETRMRVSFTGRSGKYEVGLMLVARAGVLSELEVHTFGENDGPFTLPNIASLKPQRLGNSTASSS